MRFLNILMPLIILLFSACSNKFNIVEDENTVVVKDEFVEEGKYSKVAQKITMSSISVDKVTKDDLTKVYFDYGTAYFKKEYRKVIKKHATFMNQNRDLKLFLQGNADIGGDKSAHTWLAYNRAKYVKDKLVDYGIKESRISISTNSSDKPIKLGDSEEDWAENRRVDFIYY